MNRRPVWVRIRRGVATTTELSEGFHDREAKAATLKAMLVLASVHLDEQDKPRAAERFEAARKIAYPLVAEDPSDLRMAAFLALTYEGLGRCTQGPAAVQRFAQSAELWKSWAVHGKSSGYDRDHLRDAERLLAEAGR